MKIGILLICINPEYWPYAKDMIDSANKYLLKNHNVEYLLWTDMPTGTNYGCKIFEVDPVPWPMPTLMRYHLFLQQEEELKKYDYLFFLDIDLKIIDEVGDEILGEGLTAALHPMYAIRKEYQPPYEPNPNSAAYVPLPRYYAGGVQGGKTKDFIKAMWSMKRTIDKDFNMGYRARWNDESHWNRYLYENAPSVILSPAYVYPDNLIENYYVKIWGQDYKPKIMTITKSFTLTKKGGETLAETLKTM